MKKRKVLAMLLAFAMTFSLAACGSSGGNDDQANSDANTESGSDEDAIPDNEITGDPSAKDAFVVWAWNTDFTTLQDLLVEKYPDLKDRLVFVNCGGSSYYQDKIDALLDDPSNELYPDMMLLEVGYVQKYVQSDYLMSLKDLGITDADLADQYQYTKDVVTDSNGNLKGVSWQGCPGVLIYNREAAKAVLGTDDPAEVQKSVSDWDTFTATAEKMKAAGYNMVSSVNDTYRVYSNNVSGKWVQDGKIVIDDNLMKWVDDSKKMVDAKETGTFDLWSDDWSKGFYPDGKVFCYFGPAWLINFSMAADTDGSIANQGGWGATEGPQGFFWGGTWICGATGTDNASLVKDIILKMTTDEDIMKEIVVADDDFVNNKPAMEAMAADTSYQSKVLGGQNPLAMFCAGAEKIDLSNLSAYDQGCNEEFQHAMKNYFDGKASLDDALNLFYKAVEEKYPELTH